MMAKNQEGIHDLLDRYLDGTASFIEERKVELWLEMQAVENSTWKAMNDEERMVFMKVMWKEIREKSGVYSERLTSRNQEPRIRKPGIRRVLRYAAAAAILGLVIWSVVIYNSQQSTTGDQPGSVSAVEDIKAPVHSRAKIMLADGSSIYLDSVDNGVIALQSEVQITKNTDGAIEYREGWREPHQDLVYNTLVNPRGSKVVRIILSDGTKVWLNAESSLKYPVVFKSDKREVEIEGEGYFEVASAAAPSELRSEPSRGSVPPEGGRTLRNKIPFYVRSREVVTEVLGTHFNVHAYKDEEMVKVTLVEGRIKVSLDDGAGSEEQKVLIPGQQARAENKKLEVGEIDTGPVTGWKNGWFHFASMNTEAIMKEISRWYDIEVVYSGKKGTETFSGIVSRSSNASEVMEILRRGGINYKMKDNSIVIYQ